VRQHPRRWEFSTVRRSSRAWGIRFDFLRPPTEFVTFERTGGYLRGSGSGTVRIRRGSARVTAKLPFFIPLPGRSGAG
jgi:hypothetical protein